MYVLKEVNEIDWGGAGMHWIFTFCFVSSEIWQ